MMWPLAIIKWISACLPAVLPEGIQNSAVAEDAYQAVLHSDIVQERALGVGDEGVGDPKQWHQAPVHADAVIPWENQPGVAPPLAQEDGGGVVLKCGREEKSSSQRELEVRSKHTVTTEG